MVLMVKSASYERLLMVRRLAKTEHLGGVACSSFSDAAEGSKLFCILVERRRSLETRLTSCTYQ